MIQPFQIVHPGSAEQGATAPHSPKGVPNRGGPMNPSAAAIEARFADAFVRAEVVWGETNVYVKPERAGEIIRFLHDDVSEQYDYLSDVTAVEYREMERAIEVVWHLRSLPYRRFLRLKAELPKGAPLRVPSVWPTYKGADWLEREC